MLAAFGPGRAGAARVLAPGLAMAALACLSVARAEPAGLDLVVRSREQAASRKVAEGSTPMALRIPLPDRRVWRPVLHQAARSNGLPAPFLDRVLWRESMYFPLARSRTGAQGIAQFMPATAQERSVGDPYDPRFAIPAAARYLRDLKTRFGSLALAAAAYNAGPQKVSRWLAGETSLPRETVDYVRAITGDDLGPSGAPKPLDAQRRARSASARSEAPSKLSPEAALCAKLSTPDKPCRVQATY
ncbi:soluble lytic murein transglycosylase-like protein [Rhodoblastus acidophilus]|uniref:lytic transglycosylase domain-containing protein n=1 Tax=Rhodoblastus acidophilus TaxID=1074 RepID=UPI002224971D|nr:lytic transglycosylase domain-containing protein [Rhodoblastus acidophilus]MCW2318760.1 soluble lytic murein transglycosylase-like protein [Rhodoblastus acidophilus]